MMPKIITFMVFVSLSYSESGNNPCGQLYLTQSSDKEKYLEINWNFTCKDVPDMIVLTLHDSKIEDEEAQILYKISPGSISKGYHKTNYSVKNVPLPGNWTETDDNPDLDAKCFDYYVASVRNNVVTYSQCLAIQPTWMSHFGSLRIGSMMIPGTHNSGAWQGGPPLIKKYILNQDKNFWQQLVYGIRYFDIRIGRYGKSNGLYINHSFIKCTALRPELESAANFIKKSPKEVIILDFHRFPHPKDFTIAYHKEILDLVADVFKDLIFPFPKLIHRQGPKLEEFWKSGKRVIISYNNPLVNEIDWLWRPIRREWGNIQYLDILEDYIKSRASVPAKGNPMTVLMAELTPNYISILKNVTKNLRDLAALVNRDLADWIRENNRSDNLNIIATDFFTGNDVINVAIETNLRKLIG